jgi:Flp pilus assembly protein TadD
VSVDVDNDLLRARSLIEINRPHDALPILSAVIAAAPDSYAAYCLLARCHKLDGNSTSMLEAASMAVIHGPQQEWGFRLKSIALRDLGRTDEAIANATIAVRLAPNGWQAYMALVEALLPSPDKEHRRLAYEAAKTSVGVAPEISTTHITLGRVYMSIGEDEAAHDCFVRALQMNPTDATAQTNLAILDLNRGRLTAAGKGLRAVAASDPGNRSYANHVGVPAGRWYVRALDVGTVVCLGQVLLNVLLPRPLGGALALALVAFYGAAMAVQFIRLPKSLRALVIRHVRTRDQPSSLLFAIFFALITLASLTAIIIGPDLWPLGVEEIAVVGLMMVIRFWSPLRQWRQKRVLRRRYRGYVLGPDTEAQGDPATSV